MKHGRAIAYMHLINFQREKYAKRAPIITFCPKDSLKHAANCVISAMSTIYISGKYFFYSYDKKKVPQGIISKLCLIKAKGSRKK